MYRRGYVYAMINPSMEGLVKVGKTSKDSKGRVSELSGATGVPTPFLLAFDAYFEDCSRGEEYVHTLLESSNYRVSSNREFFKAPLDVVIKAILEAQKEINCTSDIADMGSETSLSNDEFLGDPAIKPTDAGEEIYKMAQYSYFGIEEILQDYEEALELFIQAAKLGSAPACYALGCMFRDGVGCRKDNSTALNYFKEGVKRGHDDCWAEMALLFYAEGNLQNVEKCWARYFDSGFFSRPDPPNSSEYNNKLRNCLFYYRHMRMAKLPVIHQEKLKPFKHDLISYQTEMTTIAGETRDPELIGRMRGVLFDLINSL